LVPIALTSTSDRPAPRSAVPARRTSAAGARTALMPGRATCAARPATVN